MAWSVPATADPWVGLWRGPVSQSDPPLDYEVDVTLLADSAGQLAEGRVDYAALACGGRLQVVAESAGRIEAVARLTYGQQACIDGGHVSLVRQGANRLRFEWRETPQAPPLAVGTLVPLE